MSRYFVLLSFLLLLLTSIVFSTIQYNTIRRSTIDHLKNTCASIADSVDQQVNQMNMISLSTASSADIKAVFEEYASPETGAYKRNQLRRDLSANLVNAKGFDISVRQLNLFHMDENGFGTGSINGDLFSSAPLLPWYHSAVEGDGRMVVSAAKDTLLSQKSGMPSDTLYFSLCRMFFNKYHKPIGFVEVKKYYETVFTFALQPESIYHPSIYVYDQSGNLLFPFEETAVLYSDTVGAEGTGSVSDIKETGRADSYFAKKSAGNGALYNPVTGQKEYVCFEESADGHFLVVTAVRQAEFMAPVFRSLGWILGIFIILFILCLFLSHILSKSLSNPIRTIYHFLADEGKDRFSPLEMESTGIREIDKLRDSLNENIHSRKTATDTLMILKEKEVQAQMLALQSQMNPHFLYNSLSTIAEMAEEGLTEPVSQMCRDITEILRYVSSNREQVSSIEEELEICDQFLNCLKLRFGEEFHFSFSIPDEMLDFEIPKLSIQLLAENAVKAVTGTAPPWHINISGRVGFANQTDIPGRTGISEGSGTSEQTDISQKSGIAHLADTSLKTGISDQADCSAWTITVKDNGPGFDPEVAQRLRLEMQKILQNGILPSLKIEGMGILNIFIRYYLLYGNSFIFEFGNLPEGGAFVTTGRRTDESEKQPLSGDAGR